MSFGKIKKFTEEHLKNLSLYHLGQIAWNKGRKCPEISLKLTGIKRSDETKKKIADSLIGKTGRNKGKHWKVKDTSKMNKDKIGKKDPHFQKTGKKDKHKHIKKKRRKSSKVEKR